MRPPAAGTSVHLAMTKWGERPHWELDGTVLGADEHGTWLGVPAGTLHARPGMRFVSEVDSVTLVPAAAGFLATLHAPGIWCDTYVDITTAAVWDSDHRGDGGVLRAVDLDLDVIRHADGRVYVDDEDELAEHQVRYGYPDDLVVHARRACGAVLADVCAGRAPFDAVTAARWLARVACSSEDDASGRPPRP